MKVGAHDYVALRLEAIHVFSAACKLYGINGAECTRLLTSIEKASVSIQPFVRDDAPAYTIRLQAAWKSEDAIAEGGAIYDGLYSAAMFDVTTGLYHEGDAHRYVAMCSHNKRSITDSVPYGAVYLHLGGIKRRMFSFDENDNVTAFKGTAGIKPRRVNK